MFVFVLASGTAREDAYGRKRAVLGLEKDWYRIRIVRVRVQRFAVRGHGWRAPVCEVRYEAKRIHGGRSAQRKRAEGAKE
jgi:hypothetical protein